MKNYLIKNVLKAILRIFGYRNLKFKNPKKIKLDVNMLKNMVKEIMSSRQEEITCGECYEELDRYVELTLAGKDAPEALPLVKHHLEHCPDCREEFEMLLKAIQAIL